MQTASQTKNRIHFHQPLPGSCISDDLSIFQELIDLSWTCLFYAFHVARCYSGAGIGHAMKTNRNPPPWASVLEPTLDMFRNHFCVCKFWPGMGVAKSSCLMWVIADIRCKWDQSLQSFVFQKHLCNCCFQETMLNVHHQMRSPVNVCQSNNYYGCKSLQQISGYRTIGCASSDINDPA